ncbi:MAG: 30S ribosomal protein S16 [Bacteriovoracaceae bacterium]|nr:30S ribosomal protein S16 [Bacteriovoracaceae bacterium]
MIKIRLARGGRKKMPIYTIVAADSRKARDGRFLEKLGQYNPAREELLSDVKSEAIKKWVEKGAQMSDTVRTLLKRSKVEL